MSSILQCGRTTNLNSSARPRLHLSSMVIDDDAAYSARGRDRRAGMRGLARRIDVHPPDFSERSVKPSPRVDTTLVRKLPAVKIYHYPAVAPRHRDVFIT